MLDIIEQRSYDECIKYNKPKNKAHSISTFDFSSLIVNVIVKKFVPQKLRNFGAQDWFLQLVLTLIKLSLNSLYYNNSVST